MEVILLERVPRLGQMGEVVRVKDGFARNFLLPRGKALRATAENRTRFETMKSDLEARSLALKVRSRSDCREAQRQELHGPAPGVGIGSAVRLGFAARPRRPSCDVRLQRQPQSDRAQYADQDDRPARVPISLHPEIETTITVIVARNADEAARIERGEDVTQLREERTPEEEAVLAAEAFFEPEAAESVRAREGEDAEEAPAPADKE